MTISVIRISDFRNLATVDLAPYIAGMNVFCGNNGSGKTSLLEAIHYLSMGKSFRSSTASRLIRHDTEKFSLFAQVDQDPFALRRHVFCAISKGAVLRDDTKNVSPQHERPLVAIGVERASTGTSRLRMNEQDLSSMAEIAALLPVRLINSQSHLLIESGPIYRRKYLDWGLFYHSERFLPCWRQFERVLKQRNAVLKDRRSKQELDGWTDALVKHGIEFDSLRHEYICALEPILADILHELLDLSNIELVYERGWEKNVDYADVLANSYLDDFRYGHTQTGPHRADFDLYADGLPVKHFLSRGQQKLLICAMIIAQGVLLAKHTSRGLIYLVDDLPSELDLHSRQKLISLLARQPAQIFITAIELEDVCCLVNDKPKVPMKVFHVEHGAVKEGAYA